MLRCLHTVPPPSPQLASASFSLSVRPELLQSIQSVSLTRTSPKPSLSQSDQSFSKTLSLSVRPELLHGLADLAESPASQWTVVLVMELLKLWRLPDLVEERHVDVGLQEQQQRRHDDQQDAHHHGDEAGHSEQAGIRPLVGREEAEAAAQDSAHPAPPRLADALVGTVALPLCLQLGLDVGVSVELPQ